MVWSSQYWFGSDHLLQLVNCLCALWSPLEGDILLGEMHQWSRYLRVSFDKGPVVPKTTQGGVHFMDILEFLFPFCQTINLCGINAVRLKLAFCTTCAVRVLVLAQGPSFLRLRRALLRQRGDSQDERSATVTSGGVETIQRSCSTSTEEIEVVWKW